MCVTPGCKASSHYVAWFHLIRAPTGLKPIGKNRKDCDHHHVDSPHLARSNSQSGLENRRRSHQCECYSLDQRGEQRGGLLARQTQTWGISLLSFWFCIFLQLCSLSHTLQAVCLAFTSLGYGRTVIQLESLCDNCLFLLNLRYEKLTTKLWLRNSHHPWINNELTMN